MDVEVCRAPRGGSPDTSPDPEMVEGRSIGRWSVVGDKGRNAARSRGFTAARQRVPALRVRPLGRSLAQESGERRCDSRPLRRRSSGGLRAPNRSGAVLERISRATGEVRFGIACGQDTTDRVWAVRCANSATAWPRETRDLHVSGLYAFLWTAHDRTIHRLAAYGEKADGCEAQSHQGRASTSEASPYDRGRCLASQGCAGLLPIPCRSR